MAKFVYRPGHPRASPRGFVAVEDLGDDRGVSDVVPVPVMTDRYMEGVQATDGTDIGSRRKRRDYMRANNLCDADDFKGVWRAARKERESIGQPNRERREQVGRALYEIERKRR